VVDSRPGDRHLPAAEGSRGADPVRAADDGGKLVDRHAEDLAGLCRPLTRVQVQQQGPRRGRHVRDVGTAEPVQQPGIGGGDHTGRGHVLAQPHHLRRGEIGIQRQARHCLKARGV